MSCQLDPQTINATIAFHGHSCPGLAIGMRAAEIALQEMAGTDPADLVCVSETDMCGVDAIQFLTGCTYGKGNLLHRDYGKMAFSFYNRGDGRAIRLLFNPEAWGEARGVHRAHGQKRPAGLHSRTASGWRPRVRSCRSGCCGCRRRRLLRPGLHRAPAAAGPGAGQPRVRGLRRADHGIAHPPLWWPHPVHPLLCPGGAEGLSPCPIAITNQHSSLPLRLGAERRRLLRTDPCRPHRPGHRRGAHALALHRLCPG